MEHKFSASSVSQEMPTEFRFVLPKIPSYSAEKKKMKYFRKVGDCDGTKAPQVLRKKQYSLSSLTSKNKDLKTKVVNQALKRQKSTTALMLRKEELFKIRSSSLRFIRKLEYENDRKMTKVKFKRFIRSLANCKFLKYLQLCTMIETFHVHGLAHHIQYLKLLQSLRLNFILKKETGVRSFVKYIGPNLKFFRNLKLAFAQTISDTGVSMIAKEIGNLKTLQDLELDFSGNENITDLGLKSLSKQIGRNLKSLQSFTLNFCGVYGTTGQISDIGLQKLAKWLGKISDKLQRLSLDFGYQPYVTSSGIQSLADCVEHKLTNLKHVNLEFYCTEDISRSVFKSLAESCRKNLNSLSHFSFCSKGLEIESLSELKRFR